MSTSGAWLLISFILAGAAYAASLTIGFVASVILLVLGCAAAVIGVVLDIRSRRDRLGRTSR